jgi:hypothetical protein
MSLLDRVTKLEGWVRRHDSVKLTEIGVAKARQIDIDTRIDEVEARLNALSKAVELTTEARDAGGKHDNRLD